MQQKILIGLHGLARSGKDSLGKMLSESAAREGVILPTYSLAGPLKDMICALFQWDDRHRDGELKETEVEVSWYLTAFAEQWENHQMTEEFGVRLDGDFFDTLIERLDVQENVVSPRKAFQLFGTEVVRDLLGADAWLRLAARQLAKGENNGLIITDVRFTNEAQWVRDNGGYVVHVLRDGQSQPKVRQHASEAGIDPELVNYQTPECKNLDELFLESIRIEGFITEDTLRQGIETYRNLQQSVKEALR